MINTVTNVRRKDTSVQARIADYGRVSESCAHPIFGRGLRGNCPERIRLARQRAPQALVQGGIVGFSGRRLSRRRALRCSGGTGGAAGDAAADVIAIKRSLWDRF